MEKDVLLDLANETVRIYGDIKPDFAARMSRRIQRKFAVKVGPEKIADLALHYKEIYAFARSILKDYLSPSSNETADLSDVDFDNFLSSIINRFPSDDHDILQAICARAIFYEHLR